MGEVCIYDSKFSGGTIDKLHKNGVEKSNILLKSKNIGFFILDYLLSCFFSN